MNHNMNAISVPWGKTFQPGPGRTPEPELSLKTDRTRRYFFHSLLLRSLSGIA